MFTPGILGLLAALAFFVGADQRIQRLPQSVWPIQYTLSIRTDPTGNTFQGNVTIEAEVRQDTDNVTLHAKGLVLQPAVVLRTSIEDQENPETIPVSKQEMQKGSDLLILKFPATLPRGTVLSISIEFSGQLSQSRQRGYYRVKTGPEESNNWMSGTAFELNHAREAFPCWDEPEFKARFRLSMTHHTSHTALANMPIVRSEKLDQENWVTDHFNNSLVMPSFLVAFHLLQWSSRQIDTDDGHQIRIWAPAKQLKWTNHSLEFAARAHNWLQAYTGIPDPMPKQDFVIVPRFQGALENWGVITFLPAALLYKPRAESRTRRTFYSVLVTHELAHTWFGNLVTPRWWDSIWLSEGTATFFTSLATDQLEPEWDQLNHDSQRYLVSTLYDNVGPTTRPLSQPVEYARDIRHIHATAYYKGFSLMRMMYSVMEKEKFQEGIRSYLSDLQYNSTSPELLYQALQYSWEGKDLSELMAEWTNLPGVPMVNVDRSEGMITLSQERFKLQGRENSTDDSKWWIPVTFTSQSEKKFDDTQPRLWFRDVKSLPDPAPASEWFMLNLQATGTYLVRYDNKTFQQLKAAMNSEDHGGIPPLMRAKLQFDYGAFALAGVESITEVIGLTEFLRKERHSAPWAVSLGTFWRMERKLRGTQAGEKLKTHIRKLLAPEFARMGLRSLKNDSIATMRHRTQIAESACLYELPDCIVGAGGLFHKWTGQEEPDKVNPIPPELRYTVYCTAMRFDGIKQWVFLRERALKTRDPVARDTLFTALGCSNKYHLLYGLIDSQIENATMTRHDMTHLLQGLVQNNNDIGPVLDYMQHSMVTLKSKSKKNVRWSKSMLRDLAEQIIDPLQMEQLISMVSNSRSFPEAELDSVRQVVQHNLSWREKNKNLL